MTMPMFGRGSAHPGTEVTPPLFSALASMRYVLVLLTVVVNMARLDRALMPVAVVIFCLVMIVVSVLLHRLYAGKCRVPGWVLGLDFACTFILLALSPAVLGPGDTVPITGFWTAAAPLAIAFGRGWLPGGNAALAMCLITFAQNPDPNPERWGLLVVLVIGAGGLGFMVDQLHRVTAEHERLSAATALSTERQRLSRIVHDGVLQVLAMVEREAPGLGPRGQRLARLAREQESQLRALIRDETDATAGDSREVTHRNFCAALDRHASATVTVSTPAEPLLIESRRSMELDAAIGEALANVEKHAGPDARAWVLLEVEGTDAVVSIRDNGVGGEPEEFAAAMRAGRLGMKDSIHGRIRDLGGTATMRTAPGRGVEWEFRVPIEAGT
ncbi:MacS family sensor histidine kinase [Granulicoccus sp. GXG6511]|uniref:MacS family sensor histidine kinase n=1 Tax=Granulicoccus sp. GXG6511 TaxID=3381351 RepID=UPI003D7CAAAF